MLKFNQPPYKYAYTPGWGLYCGFGSVSDAFMLKSICGLKRKNERKKIYMKSDSSISEYCLEAL